MKISIEGLENRVEAFSQKLEQKDKKIETKRKTKRETLGSSDTLFRRSNI